MSDFTPAEIADALDRAHDLILVYGWQQGVNFGESLCIQMAVSVATGHGRDAWCDDRLCPLGYAAYEALSRRIGYEPWEYNDDVGRTVDDVLDLLRNTAKELRS